MYSLMGAGLHGINGINPLIAWKLWRTFVVPRMLYGIETLKITTTDIYKLEQFQKKILKQFLGLPQQTADPAIYILLAAQCIEQIIHKANIGLFLRILKDLDSVEYQLTIRQLAVKDCDSNSWFITVNEILLSYELPSSHKILLSPNTKYLAINV